MAKNNCNEIAIEVMRILQFGRGMEAFREIASQTLLSIMFSIMEL